MEKVTSKKQLVWRKNDYVWNMVVYCLNVLIFMLFYIAIKNLRGSNVQSTFSNFTEFFSFVVLLIFIFVVMAMYLAYEDRDFLKKASNSQMLFTILELSFLVCYFTGAYVNYYLRPIALVAILTLFLANTRTAIFNNMIFCVITMLFDTYLGAELNWKFMLNETFFLVNGILSSVIAIYALRNVYSRFKMLMISLLISLPTTICIAIPQVEYGAEDLLSTLLYGFASGPFSAGVCMIFLPLLEALFKKMTCFKYAELTAHKAKLIKRMIEQAPGTFNHSMVVSNIAEACATAIDEDPLLARTCAYYHDVGKLRRPEMFKENQVNSFNPHNDLTPELSANIIRSHTEDGYKLIKKNRLPQEIADVCLQHHGTMPMLFFYDKAKKYTDGDVDILQYCYVGPKPQTKIAAIIMIADGAEAATRALKDRSRDKVLEVVRLIVNERMRLGQFEECEITLKEINIIINTIVNSLTGVYHSRIEYPKVSLDGIDLKFSKEEE